MITQQTYALLALEVYAAKRLDNKPLLPPNWIEIEQTEGTDGFAYAVYKNPATNEVVISFRGTDNDVGDWTTNLGISLSQEKQGAAVYARVLRDFGADAQGSNISFTGHSLGGGLAATMAVWFNRSAVVFDPAASQSSATNQMNLYDVVMSLGANVPQSIRDYWADITTQFAAREPKVTSYYAPGSIVYAVSTVSNTITGAGQGNPVQFGSANMGSIDGMVDMHSQALLTAGLLSDTFRAATVTVQNALPLVMSKQLYALPTGGIERNFLVDIIRSEQGTGDKLTHFAADLNKLGTNITGLNKAAQDALIAQGIEWYYWQSTNYSGQEFFTQTGELLQYTTAQGDNLPGAQNKATSYISKWLTPIANDNGEFYRTDFASEYGQWSVAAGSAGVTATARDATKGQIFIGGAGADTFTGGNQGDVIFAGSGHDVLNGGAGADLLYGGTGADTYIVAAGSGRDSILDSDGLGHIELAGRSLTGRGNLILGTSVGQPYTAWRDSSNPAQPIDYVFNVLSSELTITGAGSSVIVRGFQSGKLGIAAPATRLSWRVISPSGNDSFRGGAQTRAPERRDPLAIDLDGDGVETVGIADSPVLFDHNADDIKTGTGWVKADDAWLVMERDGNGTIDTGRELFGVDTVLSGTPGQDAVYASTGFEALRMLDANHDNVFSASDAAFTQVRLWQDTNQDGISQAGELFTLAQKNIASIALNASATTINLGNGNVVSGTSVVTRTNGSTTVAGTLAVAADTTAANLELASNPFYRVFTNPVALTPTAQALPEVEGSGWVRDLREAMSLSTALAAKVQAFASAATKDAQMALLDDVLWLWADTNQTQALVTPNDAHRRFVVSGDAAASARLQAAMPVLEVFNGMTVAAAGMQAPSVTTGTDGLPVATYTMFETQVPALREAYESLRQSVYIALALQTRLKPYLDSIQLTTGVEGVTFDASALNAMLEARRLGDVSQAVADLYDLTLGTDNTLLTVGFDGVTLLGMWGRALPAGSPVREELASLGILLETYATGTTAADVFIGSPYVANAFHAGDGADFLNGGLAADQLFGESGNDKLFGLDGADGLSGGIGDDVLDGGAGNDQLGGDGGNDRLTGGLGDDVLLGGAGHDVLDGGAGVDILAGGTFGSYYWNINGAGNDSYLFGIGDGHDTVYDNDATAGNIDKIVFKAGVASVDVQAGRTGAGDLTLKIKGTSDQLSVANYFYQDGANNWQIEEIRFTDEPTTVWRLVDMKAAALLATDGNDYISGYAADDTLLGLAGNDILLGNAGNDTLDGGAGNDILCGGGHVYLPDGYVNDYADGVGNDTYLFGRGDGQDTVYDNDLTPGNIDKIVFKAGVASGDLALSRDSSNNLIIKINGTTDQIVVVKFFAQFPSQNWQVEELRFTDNPDTVWRAIDIHAAVLGATAGNDFITGTVMDDTLVGLAGDDRLLGMDGFDTLDGGTGNDLLNGNAGDDQLFGGAGDDRLNGDAGMDQLVGGDGLDQLYGGEGNDVLDGGAADDSLYGEGGNDTLLGGAGNDFLQGDDGNDTLDGGASNDGLYGGTGDDVFRFALGYGDDSVQGGDGFDSIALLGLLPADVVLGDTANGSLTIRSVATGETLTVTGAFRGLGTTGQIEQLTFADGTTWDLAAIKAKAQENPPAFLGLNLNGNRASNTLYGYRGNDQLHGRGDDYFYWTGYSDNDYLDGGAGDDFLGGDDGDDTYIFGKGYGHDLIRENSGQYVSQIWFSGGDNDKIQLLDVNSQDIVLRGRLDDSLVIEIKQTGDTLTIADQLNDYSQAYIEQLVFADGTSISYAAMIDLATHTVSAGDDYLRGTGGDDLMQGLAGNDTLVGRDGNDTLDGGLGNDTLIGEVGNDTFLFGRGGGQDIVTDYDATVGNIDRIVFKAGVAVEDVRLERDVDALVLKISGTADQIRVENYFQAGSAGAFAVEEIRFVDSASTVWNAADIEAGIATDQTLTGGSGNDTLTGAAGNDTLNGKAGADTLIGRKGNDIYVVDNTGDVIVENASEGTDAVQSSISWTLGSNLENLTLIGTTAVNGTGNPFNNVLVGNSAANTLDGGAGADTMAGGAGNDTYVVEVGTDVVTENLNEGTDLVQSSVSYTLGANVEKLTLTGNTAINGTGNALVNVLTGNAGNNVLDGGTGADTLVGGAGNDTYVVDNTGDITTEAASAGTDTVVSSLTWTLATNLENLTLSGTANINATGNTLANVITGNNGDNVISGGAGADTMIGGLGNDTYLVDVATDIVTEGLNAGTDLVNSAVTHTLGANVENLTLTGTTAINGTGNGLDNVLSGNSGVNVLTGGAGNDTYIVGTGDTTIEAANAGIDSVQTAIAWTLATNVENLTLTGSGAVNGTGNTLDNVLIGNTGANTLTGNAGNDTLNGGAGADTLIGGAGNDTYWLGRGYGADSITENDSTVGNTDVARFDTGIATDQIWLRKVSNNLEVSVIGTTDKLTLTNWYLGNQYHVEQFKTSDGKTLLDSQVQNLVSAMAAFAPPAAGQTTLAANVATALNPVIAANWQ